MKFYRLLKVSLFYKVLDTRTFNMRDLSGYMKDFIFNAGFGTYSQYTRIRQLLEKLILSLLLQNTVITGSSTKVQLFKQ